MSAALVDKDSSGTITTGDQISITFDEVMEAPDPGDTIQVTDGDGTVANITNGLNATFALDSAGNHLTITMTAGPAITTAGATTGVQSPSDITGTSGNTDLDESLEWNLANPPSTDTTL